MTWPDKHTVYDLADWLVCLFTPILPVISPQHFFWPQSRFHFPCVCTSSLWISLERLISIRMAASLAECVCGLVSGTVLKYLNWACMCRDTDSFHLRLPLVPSNRFLPTPAEISHRQTVELPVCYTASHFTQNLNVGNEKPRSSNLRCKYFKPFATSPTKG